jgi:hypothetical protein
MERFMVFPPQMTPKTGESFTKPLLFQRNQKIGKSNAKPAKFAFWSVLLAKNLNKRLDAARWTKVSPRK